MFDTYLGTANGVYHLADDNLAPLGLAQEHISAIHARHEGDSTTILVGSYGNGLFRSADDGQTWAPANDGLTAPACRQIAPDPWQPGALLAGTEPGRTFRSADGGQTWREIGQSTALPEHDRWYLPYSPRAGAVRNIYAPPGRPGRLYASVEVGGLLRSDDGGATWACGPVGHDDDIHFVTGHPQDADLLYAALGYASLAYRGQAEHPRFGGIARSRDGGQTWQKLEQDYTRAIIIPPARPDLLLACPAPHVGREGRIVASADGGDTWQPAGDGIATPMADMVELFVAAPDDAIWAVCSGGGLLRATPGEWRWRSALPAGASLIVRSIAFAPRAA
jgi:photosystem II stability/assembly factor-like uncharacterized protein